MNRTKHIVLSLLALLCCIVVTAQTSVTKGEYWFDQQYDSRQTFTLTGGVWNQQIDVSHLDAGLHVLSIRVSTDDNRWGSVLSKYFIVPQVDSSEENAVTTYRYWIDDEEAIEGAMEAGGIANIERDITSLSKGLHRISYQVKDKFNRYSPVNTSFFMVGLDASATNQIVAYEYWFNDQPHKRVEVETANVVTIDEEISIENVEPETVLADYQFDVENKQVIFTHDVLFSFRAFNNAGVGTETLTEIINDYKSVMDVPFTVLSPEKENKTVAPVGNKIQGFSFEGAVGDSLHWEFSGPDVKIDFYDVDGNRLTPETKTIDEKDVLIIKMPTTAVYALTYGATTTGEITVKVSVKIALKPGDVNGDGLVNVTDIVATVNYIMEKPSDNFNKDAADLNGDGQINVTDIVKMVSIIMNGNGGSSRRAAATSSHLVINRNNIQLKNAEAYTAAQFDINLSDGQSINNVVLNVSSDHSLYWKMVDANTYRVVVYSMTNAAFRANSDNLFTVFMTGSQNATISNELLIKADGTTGIDAIRTEIENGNVYDLNGRQVKTPRKGVYIINGRKVVVK